MFAWRALAKTCTSYIRPGLGHMSSATTGNLPVLTLYTKDPCPLCEQALQDLSSVIDQVTLEKVDITQPQNKMWWKAYRYDIPVFHLDGKFLMKHKADIDLLRKALDNHQRNAGND